MRFVSSIISAVLGISLVAATIDLAADAESLPGKRSKNTPVARQCLHDLQRFDSRLSRMGFGIASPRASGDLPPASYVFSGSNATPRKRIQSLRDAAFAAALDGDEQTCQVVLASMVSVFDEHQKLVGAEADDPLARSAWRRAHLSRAEPIAKMDHLVRTAILIGSDVRNLKDEKLGEIEDVILNPKKRNILYVLVSRSGRFVDGNKFIAVRWSDLRATVDHELYLLDVSNETFNNAPKVDRENFGETASAQWQRSLSAYWDGFLKL